MTGGCFSRHAWRRCFAYLAHLLLCATILSGCGAATSAISLTHLMPSPDLAIDGRRLLEVDYLVEENAPLNVADVEAAPPGVWKRRPWSSASYGFASRPHWFKSEVFAAAPDESGQVMIEVAYPLLDYVDLYVKKNGAANWMRWRLGDKLPFGDRPHNARSFAVPLPALQGERIEILARVQTEGAMRFPLSVWQPEKFDDAEHSSLLVNGIYVGLMAGMFVYHLIIFLIVRERIYLYFSGWILVTSGFILSYNGIAFQYLWPQATIWNDWCRIAFLLFAAGLFTSFTIQFVTSGATKSRWQHGSPILLAVGLTLCASQLPFAEAVRVALIIQLIATMTCVGLAIRQMRAGHAYARIFLYVFSAVLIGAALHTLDMLGFTKYFESSINFEVAPQLGSAYAVVLFSLALAHRLLEERRQRAMAEELTHTNALLETSMRIEQDRSETLLRLKDRLRAEAERRDQEKSRFLADAVHDLRQPLQAIGNALDPIGEAIRAGHTANALGLVKMATRASNNMRSQLAAILDLSRLESGFVHAELSDFDLVSLVRETVEQTKVNAYDSDTLVEFDWLLGKPVFVKSDPHFLQRILLNLISNGIKYRSTAGGRRSHVILSLTENGSLTQLSIRDNGLGIPEEVLENDLIFQPFFQVNNRHAEAEKGVGLGLSIVSAMLDLLGEHRLSIESRVGVGSTFKLEIPASTIAPAFEAISVDDTVAGGIDAARGKYVVLLEDDELVRESLVAVFNVHGVLYEAWGSIEEMQNCLPQTERAPDVLLSDYRLPEGKNALDAIGLMRAHWGDVPTVILTGESLDSHAVASLQGAAICYKPIAPLDLLRRIAVSATRKTGISSFGPL